MSSSQALLFALLAGTMGLFIWGRYRYDIVAFGALVIATLLEIVPAPEAFLGFGHPAVITVATVLVISRALQNSGVVDMLAAKLEVATRDPLIHIGALTGLAAVLSAFMNNVGALALLMPVALQTAATAGRSPALLLMPLSFGSILGGMMTLMGTPPNIIIASYRQELTGQSFGIFDFSPVGVILALGGVVFITFVGWRLIPKGRRGNKAGEDLFEITDYITELRVLEDSPVIGRGLRDLETLADDEVLGVGVLRGDNHIIAGARYARLRVGDIVIVASDPSALAKLVKTAKLELVGKEAFKTEDLTSEEAGVVEAVISPASPLVKRTFAGLRLGQRFNMNLIAIARQGKPFKKRLDKVRLQQGDVLLLQGERESLTETIVDLGCLPLAERGLRIRTRPSPLIPLGIFATALIAAVTGLLPVFVAFRAAIVLLVLMQVVSVREVYTSIDWPVIVLLGAMIPLGRALETTGGTDLIASGIVTVAGGLGPLFIMALLLVVTMTLSDVMNNAATAVVMAPIAATLATQLGVNLDPFLMAVAVGASCAFLTPIGHQNNVLVMGPGGYKFGDYWRMGLPLEILIVAGSVPLIAHVFPL